MAVGTAAGELHHRQWATGEEEGGIVDSDGAVCVHEIVFVEPREVVGLGHAVLVGFTGEAALQDGAEEGGGGLPRLEECPLAQLGFGLAVVVFSRKLARIGAAKTGVMYLATDGAGVLDKGGFDFCHNACSCCMLPSTLRKSSAKQNGLFGRDAATSLNVTLEQAFYCVASLEHRSV